MTLFNFIKIKPLKPSLNIVIFQKIGETLKFSDLCIQQSCSPSSSASYSKHTKYDLHDVSFLKKN